MPQTPRDAGQDYRWPLAKTAQMQEQEAASSEFFAKCGTDIDEAGQQYAASWVTTIVRVDIGSGLPWDSACSCSAKPEKFARSAWKVPRAEASAGAASTAAGSVSQAMTA